MSFAHCFRIDLIQTQLSVALQRFVQGPLSYQKHFAAMANMADEELAEAIQDVQMEALAEESAAADEELAEAIQDVQMEALAEEMAEESAEDKELAEIKADPMEAVAEEMVDETAAADGELTEGWEHLSRGELVHDVCYLFARVLQDYVDMAENVEELCNFAVAMVSKWFLEDGDYKKFAVKHKGIEVDVRAMLWQILQENFEDKSEGEDGEDGEEDSEIGEDSKDGEEQCITPGPNTTQANINKFFDKNARYLNLNKFA
jgi:hypothetical protein